MEIDIQKTLDNPVLEYTKIKNQELYYKGKNPALFEPIAKPHPDNRVPIPYGRRFVDLTTGYLAKPGNITYQDGAWPSLEPIYNANEETLATMNIFKTACKHGRGFELHWLENGQPRFKQLPIGQVYPIYSDDIDHKIIGALWLRKIGDTDYVTAWDSTTRSEYQKTGKDWTLISEELHLYGSVPVLEILGNEDRENVFDHVTPMIDAIDRMISDVANESDKYANAMLLMANRLSGMKDENGLTDIDKIKQAKTFEGLGDDQDVRGKVAYLYKDIPTPFLELSLDKFNTLIYEMANQFNPNDDNFAAASGQAQKYKLLAFIYSCDERSAYLIRFLQDRVRLIAQVLRNLGRPVTGENDVKITIQANLPNNLLEIAQTAAQAAGSISRESALNLWPSNIIGDKAEELKRLEADNQAQGILENV